MPIKQPYNNPKNPNYSVNAVLLTIPPHTFSKFPIHSIVTKLLNLIYALIYKKSLNMISLWFSWDSTQSWSGIFPHKLSQTSHVYSTSRFSLLNWISGLLHFPRLLQLSLFPASLYWLSLKTITGSFRFLSMVCCFGWAVWYFPSLGLEWSVLYYRFLVLWQD